MYAHTPSFPAVDLAAPARFSIFVIGLRADSLASLYFFVIARFVASLLYMHKGERMRQ